MSFSQEIRKKFLTYFEKRGHTLVPSSPVIPYEDPSLLFTNAGMNQFKDVFLGTSRRDYTSAVTVQKCIRAGGKHNDLENVGHTTRHLTFFEMLGNFSFGAYFKKEAIRFAWEVATEIFEFPEDKIWPTVYLTDEEAFSLWTTYVKPEKIVRFGEKENFWAMGEIGPCGPCSELLFDRGKGYGDAEHPKDDVTQTRFLEFWNLVFMQYNKDTQGTLVSLPQAAVDTGSGLERVVALKKGVESVFDTDILFGIIQSIEGVSKVRYERHGALAPSFHVIADHLRTLAFSIADGAHPSNTDRGYVLRKILRRAVRYGRMLNMETPFLAKIFPMLQNLMGEDYPELFSASDLIIEILTKEEETFFRTLKKGGALMQRVIQRSKGKISGEDSFTLKDTYGLPLEEILLLAKDSNLSVDIDAFHLLEGASKERSRNNQSTTSIEAAENIFVPFSEKITFKGYETLSLSSSILGLISHGQFVSKLQEGEKGMVLLEETPFYAEMGGQVGDVGYIDNFEVENTLSPYKGVIVHVGILKKGLFTIGQKVRASVDKKRRDSICLYHTATHLLHYALEHVLGEHIKQTGSLVAPDRLRFDFNHHKALSSEELEKVETLINQKIYEDYPIRTYTVPYEEVKKNRKIKQFFGEKYGREVRVVDIDFSKELCGGTHAPNTASLHLFKIVKEGGIAAGVRRIEALVGKEALVTLQKESATLTTLSSLLKVSHEQVVERIKHLLKEKKELEREIKYLKQKEIEDVAVLLLKTKEVKGLYHLVFSSTHLPLKPLADAIISKDTKSVVFLYQEDGERLCYLLRLGNNTEPLAAEVILEPIKTLFCGHGGGKGSLAQGSSKKVSKEYIQKAKEIILSSL